MEDIQNARQALQDVDACSEGELVADEATCLLHDSHERAIQENPNVIRIATADEPIFAKTCRRCRVKTATEFLGREIR